MGVELIEVCKLPNGRNERYVQIWPILGPYVSFMHLAYQT